jgi:hypothetical protein
MNTSRIPESLDEVIGIIGITSTLKLVEAFGGTSIRIPSRRNLNESNPLAQVIGMDALLGLITKIGVGIYLYIPRCTSSMRLKRDQQIVALSATLSVEALARKFNLSDRQIWSILKKTPVDDQHAPANSIPPNQPT